MNSNTTISTIFSQVTPSIRIHLLHLFFPQDFMAVIKLNIVLGLLHPIYRITSKLLVTKEQDGSFTFFLLLTVHEICLNKSLVQPC